MPSTDAEKINHQSELENIIYSVDHIFPETIDESIVLLDREESSIEDISDNNLRYVDQVWQVKLSEYRYCDRIATMLIGAQKTLAEIKQMFDIDANWGQLLSENTVSGYLKDAKYWSRRVEELKKDMREIEYIPEDYKKDLHQRVFFCEKVLSLVHDIAVDLEKYK